MPIGFSSFETVIDQTILHRGVSYFVDEKVVKVWKYSIGYIVANVEGTKKYRVELLINQNILQDYTCSCPYDQGPVCKHIVAVVCYVKNGGPWERPVFDMEW